MDNRDAPSQLEITDTDIDKFFEGIDSQELSDYMVNTALKIAHGPQCSATFQIYDSRTISLGTLAAHRLRYEIFSNGQSKGKFQCIFNTSYFSEKAEDYCIEIEEVKPII